MSGIVSKPKPLPTTDTTAPTITDTGRQQQDAIDELLRRRGRSSTMTTGSSGASLQAPTGAAQALGL